MLLRETVSDSELVQRIRRGDHGAFRLLVERYQSQVAATAVGMLGPGPDAEDVGQNTFVRFYRAVDRFRGDASVGTYLTRIAINLSLNTLKRRKRAHDRFFDGDVGELPVVANERTDGNVQRDENRRLVQQAIDRLPPKQRAVVVLRIIQGFSTRETAQLLGLPLGTVLSRLSRAQDRLKEWLAPFVDEELA